MRIRKPNAAQVVAAAVIAGIAGAGIILFPVILNIIEAG